MAQRRCRSLQVLAYIVLAGASAVIRAQPASASTQEVVGSWLVEYRTTAFKVEAVEEGLPEGNARVVTVKLRNISGRPITAIAIDIEDAQSRTDWSWSGRPAKPGEIREYKVRNSLDAEPHRHVRLNAVLFGDKGPDDGDRSSLDVLRFFRLGGLLEENRCLAIFNRLDATSLDDATVAALLGSAIDTPKTLEEALASLPEIAQSKASSHDRIRAASAVAKQAFLDEVQVRRHLCYDEVRKLKASSEEPGMERELGSQIDKLRRQHQLGSDRVRVACERDMEAGQ